MEKTGEATEKRVPMSPNNEDMIAKYLETLNSFKRSTFVLKGGNALVQCYQLPRISSDIDLDAPTRSARNNVLVSATEKFCAENGCSFRIAKNTEMVQRVFIHSSENNDQPLKVEASFRRQNIGPDKVTKINGITVYTLSELVNMKCKAYIDRDRIRDLYDLAYIATHFQDELTTELKKSIADAFSSKGIEQLDYLLKSDKCPQEINTSYLAEMFLDAYDYVGLMEDAPRADHTQEKQPSFTEISQECSKQVSTHNALEAAQEINRSNEKNQQL